MDLFGQYNDAVIALFDGNAYLSGGVAAKVYSVDTDSDEIGSTSKTEEERLKEINDQLNNTGVVGTYHGLRIEGQEGDRVVCRGAIWWEVNKTQNKTSTGTQKPGRLIWQESVAILRRFCPTLSNDNESPAVPIKPFSMATIKGAERIGEDEGVELFMIDFETRLAL